jgi:hypothetical protein
MDYGPSVTGELKSPLNFGVDWVIIGTIYYPDSKLDDLVKSQNLDGKEKSSPAFRGTRRAKPPE